MPAPTIHFRDAVLTTASWGDCFFEWWQGSGDLPYVRTMRLTHEAAIRARPGRKIAILTLVELATLRGVSEEARKEAISRLKAVRDHTASQATAITSRGFSSSIVRSMAAGFALISRPPYPNKVFDSFDGAVAWTAGQVGAPVAELRAAWDSLARAAQVGTLAGSVG